jgi:pheromone shutdown protein TraB
MPDWQVPAKVRNTLVTVLMLSFGSTRILTGQFASLGGRTAGAQVLVIGTYHMSNPGLDAVNLTADDVLAPKRQQEIEQLAAKIETFRPTKVAVEIPYGRDSMSNALYQRYLAGSHPLDRTEMQQVGFRVAKAAGLPHIHGIDYDLDVNLASVMVWALTHGQPELAAAAQSLSSRLLAEADSMMKHASVSEIVAALNSPRADSAHGIYLAALRVGSDTSYPGATAAARWYERNLRIASNILRVIDSPSDRVLVLIGAAHGPILRELLERVPGIRVVPAASVLR